MPGGSGRGYGPAVTAAPDDLVYASVSHELGTAFLSGAVPSLAFGRSIGCPIRLGHQPVLDIAIPRLAGRILMVGTGRVAVENTAERLAFDVVTSGEPLQAVRPGGLYSPPRPTWEVRLAGAQRCYALRVEILSRPHPVPTAVEGMGGEPVTRLDPDLTERQWAVLERYTAPLRAGRTTPATHAQVADSLGWSMATVRIECGAIWNSFVLAGVPMRDFPDKRDAIVDAATRHHLMP
jgi:hypothetical protein